MRELRPILVTSHQFSLNGLFHGWGGLESNSKEKAYAVIEHKSGEIYFYSFNLYSFKFLDKEKAGQP